MDCHLFRMLIQRYHDGELAPIERAEYERHLGACGSCRKLDAELGLVFESLAGAPLHEPPAGFEAAVMARVDVGRYRVPAAVRAMRRAGRRWDRLPTPARVTARAALLLAGLIIVYRPFLYYLLSLWNRITAVTATGLVALRDFGDRSVIVVQHLKSTASYRMAWDTLVRITQRLLGDEPLPYFAATMGVCLVILLVAAARARSGGKGETHVGIY